MYKIIIHIYSFHIVCMLLDAVLEIMLNAYKTKKSLIIHTSHIIHKVIKESFHSDKIL